MEDRPRKATTQFLVLVRVCLHCRRHGLTGYGCTQACAGAKVLTIDILIAKLRAAQLAVVYRHGAADRH